MAIHYQIPFKSLRAGTVYTVNIHDADYTGKPIVLLGAADPFVTQEDDSDDPFQPIRTQTGYLRIADNGKDTAGNSFDWRSLIPATDTDHPVTLTDAAGTIHWQGFMQAQNFGSPLYETPQEREFPVQCMLQSVSSIEVRTDITAIHNFAYLLDYIFKSIPSLTIAGYVIQGGSDARQWLTSQVDWRNFMNIGDDGVTPRFNLYEILEDICRFWGWTLRTYRQTVYMLCAEDQAEQQLLTLTPAQLTALGAVTSATTATELSAIGTVTATFPTATITSGFASTANDVELLRGNNKAIVKADANAQTEVLKCFPKDIRDQLEALNENGYTYTPIDDDIGYFSTGDWTKSTGNGRCTGMNLVVIPGNYGSISRRLFQEDKDDSDYSSVKDCIHFSSYRTGAFDVNNSPAMVQLQTVYETIYGGGHIRMSGSIYKKGEKYAETKNRVTRSFRMRIGIGADYISAKWLNIENETDGFTWGNNQQELVVSILNQPTLNVVAIVSQANAIGTNVYSYQPMGADIPVPEGLTGKLFVDFTGSDDREYFRIGDDWDLADFKIEYSRDGIALFTSGTTSWGTHVITTDRESTREYTATNANKTQQEWNADCIFASDNDMAYGYGLLTSRDGKCLKTTAYGSGTSEEAPEQHLANRVATYWQQARKLYRLSLMDNLAAVSGILPTTKVTIDDTVCHPVGISKAWRDDERQLTLIEL